MAGGRSAWWRGHPCPRCPFILSPSTMPVDFTATRLFVRSALTEGTRVDLDRDQANYLVNVLSLGAGDSILVFNGTDGELRAQLASAGKKAWRLDIGQRTQRQPPSPGLHYVFAPLKQARLDYMIQKAVEMGAGRLRPVITRHTQVTRFNTDRAEANAIEAAEQCGILSIPAIDEPVPLTRLIDEWDHTRRIIFCDEGDVRADPLAILAGLQPSPLAVLIGPEGGFADDERAFLHSKPFVTAIPLGPRILRADTAAVAGLALVQAVLGDWRNPPPPPR